MPANAPDIAERPFVETSVARHIASRCTVTDEERGICVIAGAWGMGKTTALVQYQRDNPLNVVYVKVDPGSSKKGAACSTTMLLVLEAIEAQLGVAERHTVNNAYWALRLSLYNSIKHWQRQFFESDDPSSERLTFVFDEAQYLSREAIEMLRFWNDDARSAMPFPVGLIFVGNNEFALKEDNTGQSVLSGAVRSRALFIESLDYADVSDADLVLFFQSRGITDAAALAAIVSYFSQRGVRRDLRNAERFVGVFKRRAGTSPVTAATVLAVLAPG